MQSGYGHRGIAKAAMWFKNNVTEELTGYVNVRRKAAAVVRLCIRLSVCLYESPLLFVHDVDPAADHYPTNRTALGTR